MNLTHQIFGYLRVLRPGRLDGRRRVYWVCRCRCGVEKEIRSDALRADGGTRSCGCLRIAAVKALGHHHPPDERFSRLVIIKQAGTIKKRGRVYLCLCDCGEKVKVQGQHLRDGLISHVVAGIAKVVPLTLNMGSVASRGRRQPTPPTCARKVSAAIRDARKLNTFKIKALNSDSITSTISMTKSGISHIAIAG